MYGARATPGTLDRNELALVHKYGRFLFQCSANKNVAEGKAMIAAIRRALP